MPTPLIEPLAVSIKTFQAMTDIGRTSTYALIAQARLQKIKVLGRTLITVESINALFAEAVADAQQTR